MAVIDLLYLSRRCDILGIFWSPEQLVEQFQFPKGFGDIFELALIPMLMSDTDMLINPSGCFVGLGCLAILFFVGSKPQRRAAAWIAVGSGANRDPLDWSKGCGFRLVCRRLVTNFLFTANQGILFETDLLVSGAVLFVGVTVLFAAKVGFNVSIPIVDRTIDEMLTSQRSTTGCNARAPCPGSER